MSSVLQKWLSVRPAFEHVSSQLSCNAGRSRTLDQSYGDLEPTQERGGL